VKPVPATDELTVLGDASRYLLGSVLLVRDANLSAPTPCPEWDLRGLLRHLTASLSDVADVLAGRESPVAAPTSRGDNDPVAAIRAGVIDLLAAWTFASTATGRCEVAGRTLPAEIVAHVAATEMVLHGWDIAVACQTDRPIPTTLALALLDVSPRLAEAGVAAHAFAKPVAVSPAATATKRLLALYGRRSRVVAV
jgi:uncharacterized protein (TIGR03086 family)